MIKNLTALFLLFGLLTINAQQPGEDELGAWYMYFGTNKVSERFSVHTEAQLRLYETTNNFNQLLLRTGLNYHINPEAIATAGYGYIDTDNTFYDGVFDINLIEHRIFEQFILKNNVWEFLFEHRYRLEQRFLDFDGVKDTQHRARYRLQMTLPLTDTFFLNFYDELFINLQDDLFGQNRLYGAVGVNITNNSSLQVGYLRNQFSNAVYDRLQFAVFYNPDLTGWFKKKKP
ncbi:DUF2490 domain-containing protein [Allomuricauda sp. NBRC 101325]|uniref:DUF2490 domain-containing protein n=1 Tax=Allomuricauda sp. NBRC 101325 TaxID=1113758 RepID=UPI0024A01E83|nr:DUF2490 domain-containing protein [Muricauda sp. NBRC 101325]GLU44336.1 hypothetical protein Musp01_19600 [Muricauda sp. NBRC 101325]